MYIDPGKMRQRVILQRSSLATGPTGQAVPTWNTIGTYYAQIVPLAGRELFYARQVVATADFKIVMRQATPVLPTDRLVWGSITIHLNSVAAVDALNEFYELLGTQQRPS